MGLKSPPIVLGGLGEGSIRKNRLSTSLSWRTPISVLGVQDQIQITTDILPDPLDTEGKKLQKNVETIPQPDDYLRDISL